MTMQTTQLPTSDPAAQAVVDLDAIQHNVRLLREHAGSAQVMAVLKADGYGHGATQVARAALAAGAAELGVATLDEAMAIRRDGVTAPLLAWLHAPGTDFAPALTADVQLAVSSARQLGDLLDAVTRTGRAATVTVKVDTGLSRNGADSAEFAAMLPVLARARADDAIRLRGIMSHLACGDDPDSPVNDLQAQRFSDLRAQARDAGVEFEVAHLCNSPAAMTRPDLAFDMVRPGIAVYGQTPIATRGDMGLLPAMTLKCPVALIRSINAGDGVSYGHTWIADRDTTVALLPIGYADGVFRGLSGRIDVMINGRRRRNVGRICMDQFVVDLGPGPVDVAEGDDAILFGAGTARRVDRAGLGRTARHHQLRGGHQSARQGHPGVPRCYRDRYDGQGQLSAKDSRKSVGRIRTGRWLAGAAGLAAVGSGVGFSVAHSLGRRVSRDDPHHGEDFELLDADRSYVVTTADGVPLAVREVGPADAPLTVVFAHGFCLRMGAFHFQRARLTEQWGPQVRMVFYDQRGHGQSGAAPPESYTVPQLGQDLEAVLAVMAPRGPVVLVGHSMGGMTVLAHARQYPQRYRSRIVGVALISTAAEGVSRSPLGEILRNPALEAARIAVRYAPKTVHRTRGAARSIIGPVLRAASYGDVEGQPERRRVLRADDARHAHRHAGRVPARARGARGDAGPADSGQGAEPDRVRRQRPADPEGVPRRPWRRSCRSPSW